MLKPKVMYEMIGELKGVRQHLQFSTNFHTRNPTTPNIKTENTFENQYHFEEI